MNNVINIKTMKKIYEEKKAYNTNFKANKELNLFKNFFNKINNDSLILNINNPNLNFYKLLNSKIKKSNELISFISDKNKPEILKNKYKSPNILILNGPFDQNNLKNNIADLIITYNLLQIKNKKSLIEIYRVSKKECYILFHEKINIENNIDRNFEISIKNIKKNISYLKKINYQIKIYSNNNFELKIENNINKLIDFKNVLNNINNNKKNIQLDLIIEGFLIK